jgi:NTP pyrophosphatase (non-canonical NTP hydrolase)
MSEIKPYKDVYDYHGWRVQNKQFVSEAHELAEAIHDYQVENSLRNWNHITEEVADILFMTNQVIDAYNISDENIEAWLSYKRKRESKRITNGYYEK